MNPSFQELAQHFHQCSLKNLANIYGIQNVISLLIVRRIKIDNETRTETTL